MKNIIFVFMFCFLFFSSKGQNKNDINDFINESLVGYLAHIKNIDDLYLLLDYYPFNFTFDERIKKMNLQQISLINPDKKLLKKEKHVLFFEGIELNETQLTIKLSERYLKLKKRNSLQISISDWRYFIYNYSCEKQKWEFVETKYGGI